MIQGMDKWIKGENDLDIWSQQESSITNGIMDIKNSVDISVINTKNVGTTKLRC